MNAQARAEAGSAAGLVDGLPFSLPPRRPRRVKPGRRLYERHDPARPADAHPGPDPHPPLPAIYITVAARGHRTPLAARSGLGLSTELQEPQVGDPLPSPPDRARPLQFSPRVLRHYTKQWLESVNRHDDVVVRREDYPIPGRWRERYWREHEIQTRFFEALYQLN